MKHSAQEEELLVILHPMLLGDQRAENEGSQYMIVNNRS
jgi:hypothetical protein